MKKIEKYIIAVIVLIAIGAIGTAVYFVINEVNKNHNQTNNDDFYEEKANKNGYAIYNNQITEIYEGLDLFDLGIKVENISNSSIIVTARNGQNKYSCNFEEYCIIWTSLEDEFYHVTINFTKTKKSDLKEYIPNKEDEKNYKKTSLTFYKNDRELSSFECNGECNVILFDVQIPENSDYYVKINDYINEERITYLGYDNSNVIIEYCPNEICSIISEDWFSPTNNEDKNVGIALLYNIETGKYDIFENIQNIMTSKNKVFLINDNNDKDEFTLLLPNGFSRKLSSEPYCYIWEGCNYFGNYGRFSEDVLVTLLDDKVGIEDLKTGKIIIKHQYKDIYSYDKYTYIAKKEDLYNVYDSKSSAKLFNNDYKIISKIDNSAYIVLNDHKFQVINEKEEVISKNDFEVKEIGDMEPKLINGYDIFEENEKYHIIIAPPTGSTTLQYYYNHNERKFEKIDEESSNYHYF